MLYITMDYRWFLTGNINNENKKQNKTNKKQNNELMKCK